ncbi:MAG TPA: isoprenylcysteine carboxylmethyltransferase family protein, partial [Paracoccus sp. (in: a-proteobacteria)]|nr:isoprenylcysteine carboxylmethyltransferase family protein [Paracoccus sp. (in: a-proteobacteria)]
MMQRIADYPVSWVALLGVLAALAGWIAPMPLPLARPFGWLLIAAGLGLVLVAGITMRRARATVDPTRPPTALVTHG